MTAVAVQSHTNWSNFWSVTVQFKHRVCIAIGWISCVSGFILIDFFGVTHYDYPMSTVMWPVQAFASVTCVLSLAVQKNLGTAAFEMRN